MAPRTFLAAATALALLACSAPDRRPADITISNGWTREIASGQSTAAVYLTIANKGEGSDRLVDVESAQGEATLHQSSNSDGVARMRPLEDGLDIAPRSTVELKPGATHIMVSGIKQRPVSVLTLSFERSGQRTATVRVVPAAGGNPHSEHGM